MVAADAAVELAVADLRVPRVVAADAAVEGSFLVLVVVDAAVLHLQFCFHPSVI